MNASATSAAPLNGISLPREPRPRIGFLDGMRGLAALYVVVGHVMEVGGLEFLRLPKLLAAGLKLLAYGHYAVAVFIVLSGYCLMLPVARSQSGALPGGFREYVRRRSLRILPPYYAAIVFSLLLIAAVPGLRHGTGTTWDKCLPAFDLSAIVPHLLLIHNLNHAWVDRINAPMWSVATEWQIYFVFACVLLPVWRRFGVGVSTLVGIGLGVFPVLAFGFESGCLWYLGLFAIGMAGAVINFSPTADWGRRVHWGAVAWGATLLSGALFFGARGWSHYHLWCVDTVLGLAVAAWIVHWCGACRGVISEKRRNAPASFVVRLLESKPVAGLGAFSYSLYLIHMPIVGLLYLIATRMGLGPYVRLAAMAVVGIPLIVLVSYGFYQIAERPVLAQRDRTRRSAPPERQADLAPQVGMTLGTKLVDAPAA